MRALTAGQVLDVWESALSLASPRRAIALLAAACPELQLDEITALPLGYRNGLLLRLHEQLFGPALTLTASCPACGERLESSLRTADLQMPAEPTQVEPMQIRRSLALAGRQIAFRVPTGGDLIDLPDDGAQARLALLSRCLIGGDALDSGVGALSAEDVAAIADAMAVADPQANVDIGVVCAACAHRWDCAFDIASYLWREIDAWAQRMLREVHALARAYCWSERDILALSPTRRQIYLEWSRA